MKCPYCGYDCLPDALSCPKCRNLVYDDERLNALRELDAKEAKVAKDTNETNQNGHNLNDTKPDSNFPQSTQDLNSTINGHTLLPHEILKFLDHDTLMKQLIASISAATTSIIIVTPYVSIKNDLIMVAIAAVKRGVKVGIYANFIASQTDEDAYSYLKLHKVQVTIIDELVSKICIIDNKEIYIPTMAFTGEMEKKMIAFGIYSTSESLILQAVSHIINLESTGRDYKELNAITEMEDKQRSREEQFEKSRQKTEFMLSTLSNLQKSNFEILRTWRNEKARKMDVAPFIIAQNESLIQIVLRKPQTKEELEQVKGFGKNRVEKYGDEILEFVRRFVD